ncbi:hypothetical protein ACFFV7_08160 [Nonomuraea spiralis]|uniref:Uncharacterized protein n=1 Tax=Nonomuraea spiralis TaxID=46182 RepID=A0ABV5I9Z9_9ACTN|nr:hypothetical protein [Nonomuraea spiralis]GGT07153.1 hypothetical protein GCM10010176_059560 [Nonomuraea spiralis]
MTRSLLLVPLAAGTLTVPMHVPAPAPVPVHVPVHVSVPVPAFPAATELAIRAITVRPADPVVGAHDSVSLVIDVIARGARGKNGVTVKVEPGVPPGPLLSAKPPVTDAPAADPALQPPGRPEPPSSSDAAQEAEPGIAPDTSTGAAPGAPAPGGASEAPPLLRAPLLELPPSLGVGAQLELQRAPAAKPFPTRQDWRRTEVPPARMAGDWETWRFLPDKKLNRFYPTGTWTITATAGGANGATVTEYASFQLRRATQLSSVRVERSPKSAAGVRLRGSLTRIDPRGFIDFGPYAKQRLELQWRAEGSATWEDVGETTTDAAGAFIRTVPFRRGGLWRVRFPGNTHYAPDATKPRQIAM